MIELEEASLFGVKITTSPEDKILEYIKENLGNGRKKIFIVTPNPEIIMHAVKNPEFKSILNSADIALPDGIGVVTALKFMANLKLKRITGIDFMERLCNEVSKDTFKGSKYTDKIALFGGEPHIAERVSECLQKKYSGLKISYVTDIWDEAKFGNKKAALLFVAMGFPLQEKWIYENLDKLPIGLSMGVGGSFDFIAKKVNRAPKFMRKFGLEWFYRLVRQPWRAKRQLALISFTILVLRSKLAS